MNLNEFAKEVHQNAVAHGWWDKERDDGEIIALIHGEWSAALEEYRAGQPLVWYEGICTEYGGKCIPDAQDECPEIESECGAYKRGKPEGVAVELIDGCIRVLDFLGKNDLRFPEEVATVEALIDCTDSRVIASLSVPYKNRTLPQIVTTLHWYTSEYYNVESMSYLTLAEAVALAFLWIRNKGLNPEAIMLEKHEYNKTREYKHGGKVC